MARKKIEKSVLFSATESLLMEQGFRGFHFKLLSERLKIGRSTLYEYYASKEELLTDYFHYIMKMIMEECDEVSKDISPEQRLKNILKVFLKYSQIHQISVVIPFIDPTHSAKVEATLTSLKRDYELLYQQIIKLIEDAKKENQIRNDLETGIIAGMLFNAIQVPNKVGYGEGRSSEMVLEILFHGISQ